ncbi:MAG: hypothetical protein JW855_01605 [Gammaproteobacteria bacterium]|nr:hypothetical protein [Gammaproteobacteria bacterium]
MQKNISSDTLEKRKIHINGFHFFSISRCFLPLFLYGGIAFAGTSNQLLDGMYINIGADAYRTDIPKLGVGTIGDSTKPIISISKPQTAPAYSFTIGKKMCRCREDILTQLFGNENRMELQINYTNFNAHKKVSTIPNGKLWFIDGSGKVWHSGWDTANIYDAKINFRHQNIQLAAYYRGHQYLNSLSVTHDPFVGIIGGDLDDQYKAAIDYDPRPRHPNTEVYTDNERFEVQSRMMGLAVGDQLNFLMTPQWVAFARAEIQPVYMMEKLNAKQESVNVPEPVGYEKKVHDTVNKFSYRAEGNIGLTYKFNRKFMSPSVSLDYGALYWAYRPEVITPTGADNKPVYLKSHAQIDQFVGIQVHIPL